MLINNVIKFIWSYLTISQYLSYALLSTEGKCVLDRNRIPNLCNQFIDSSVYISDRLNLKIIDNKLSTYYNDEYKQLGDKCILNKLEFLCLNVFIPCTTESNQIVLNKLTINSNKFDANNCLERDSDHLDILKDITPYNSISHTENRVDDADVDINYQRRLDTTYGKCPIGFVIPDDPTNKLVQWVDNTNCAYSCRSPKFSKKEWKALDLIATIIPAISFAFIFYLILTWCLDKNRHKKYLVLCFSLPHAIACLWFIIMSGYQNDSRYCKDNAVPITSNDGANLCSVESFISLYALLSGTIAWCIQAIDLFIKIVLGLKFESFYVYNLSAIIILPVPALIYLGVSKSYGYNGQLPYCLISSSANNNIDIAILYLPCLFITTIGSITMIPVLVKIVKTALKAKSKIIPVNVIRNPTTDKLQSSISTKFPIKITVSRNSSIETKNTLSNVPSPKATDLPNPLSPQSNKSRRSLTFITTSEQTINGALAKRRRNFSVLRTTSAFLYIFLTVWLSWFIYRGLKYHNQSKDDSSFKDWTDCVFTNYDESLGDDSWIDKCKISYKSSVSFAFTIWSCICYFGQCIIVTSIFISNNVMKGHIRTIKVIINKYIFGIIPVNDNNKSIYMAGKNSSKAFSSMGL